MGSSGGGGSSGAVSWPPYLELAHSNWLGDGNDLVDNQMQDKLMAAFGVQPWAGAIAHDPSPALEESAAAIEVFASLLAGIDDRSDWASRYTQAILSIGTPDELIIDDIAIDSIEIDDIADTSDVDGITEAVIVADVGAFADQLDDEITTKVLPRFRRGMQDINAVVSSSFAVGAAIIEGFRDRDVAKHSSSIRLMAAAKNADVDLANEELHLDVKKVNVGKDVSLAGINMTKDVDVGKSNLLKDIEVDSINVRTAAEYARMYMDGASQMFQLMIQRISWEEVHSKIMVESNRIKIVAMKEYYERIDTINESDALWDLEVFQYGANLLAGPSGGVKATKGDKPNMAASTIGGGLGGAAAGALVGAKIGGVGSYWGAAAGAVLGAAAGYLGAR